jgi:hypothetical protein
MFRPLALLLALVGLAAQTPRAVTQDEAQLHRPRSPRLVFWAWERREDLRQLPPDAAIAFLAETVTVGRDRTEVVPRRQPLRVNRAALLYAVTRIDVEPGAIASFTPGDVSTVADAIARTGRLPQVGGVQVDFDARASERPTYRSLLQAVRDRIGTMPLSMTALASWCGDDSWIDTLPVDEAIPMLFRMGPFNEPFRHAAASGWSARRCRGSLGVSVDEPDSLRYRAHRVYVFNPRSWSDGAIADVRTRYQP